jgi:dipeptidyl aminopeptidase/acylaminoacyl peptidase
VFEQLILPDEIHGFLRNDSWVKVFGAIADFFDRYLNRQEQLEAGDLFP